MSNYWDDIIDDLAEIGRNELKGARLFDVAVDTENNTHLLALMHILRAQLNAKSDELYRIHSMRDIGV